MVAFLTRRLVAAVVTLLIASFVLFAVVSLLPGDEVWGMLGPGSVDTAAYQAMVAKLHLDRPLVVQYWYFLSDFVRGDLGRTLFGEPISDVIAFSLPVSLRILAGVFALQVVIAPALIWLAGMRPHTRLDNLAETVTVVIVAVPSLVAAYIVQAVFVYWTDFARSPVWEPASSYPQWMNYLMPILALGLGIAAHLAVVGRVELRAALSTPWVKAARALGMPRSHLVRIDALRPAAGAMVQLLAANLAVLVTGLLVVEDVFRVPGVGNGMLRAIQRQDRHLIVTLVLVGVIAVNTVADLVHAWLDPRVREDDVLTDPAHARPDH